MDREETAAPAWRWDPVALGGELEAAGYDVDGTEATMGVGGGSLRGRLDRGSRSYVVVLDAGGRFRGVVTVVEDETGGSASVAGAALRVVAETRRAVMVGGTLTDPAQVGPVLEALDGLASGLPGDAGSFGTEPGDAAQGYDDR